MKTVRAHGMRPYIRIANVERKQTMPFVQSKSVSWVARDIVPCRIVKAEP